MDFLSENEDEMVEDSLDDEDWESGEEDLDDTSFVCEDCDYRWEDISQEEQESGLIVCPMCGSVNVTQL